MKPKNILNQRKKFFSIYKYIEELQFKLYNILCKQKSL